MGSFRDKILKNGKKAMVMKYIVFLVIALISLILVFSFLYKLYSKTIGFSGEKNCRNSIVLQETLADKMPTTKYTKPWPATCKTKDKVSEAKTAEDAKKDLAEMMWWCWWMMGEGAIRPFDKDWFSGGRKCFVCYTAQFPYLQGQVSRQGFTSYLREKGKEGATYYDYLKYSEDKVIENPMTDDIDKKGIYAIVYTSPADPTFSPILGCLGIGAIGALGGGIVAVPSYIGCLGASAVVQVVESMKEDLVYVADVSKNSASCYGSWYTGGERVQTTE
ncbi:hypothetical protein COV19_06480 [Candidatus Woesearchaeota archaeon CG10_big_fil_rev_8_21_14_0_10_44_13]|nr:MAG: hypothetical protein COV19_06480 [Candidatus Woesearchaeota archaeon CG10_big_fil_rev_8_21_14_0_10_44_13]